MKSLIAAALLVFMAEPCFAETFQEVSALYGQRKFTAAQAVLDRHLAKNPRDLTAHYWRGLCLQGQNQMAQAATEYKWVAQCAGSNPIGAKAQAALNGLSSYKTTRVSPNPSGFSRGSIGGGGGRVTVIEFHTAWCGVCKRYKPVFEAASAHLASVAEFKSLDAEESANVEMAQKYSIRAYPTTLILDRNGKVLDRMEGATDEAGLARMISVARSKT